MIITPEELGEWETLARRLKALGGWKNEGDAERLLASVADARKWLAKVGEVLTAEREAIAARLELLAETAHGDPAAALVSAAEEVRARGEAASKAQPCPAALAGRESG